MNDSEETRSVSKAGTVSFACALAVVAMIELLGNTMVLCVVYHQWKNIKQRATNFLLANLAVIDLLVAIYLIPVSFAVTIGADHALNYTSCQINGLMNNLIGSASILTMAVISIDRYKVIVSSPGHRLKFTHARCLIGGVWILAFTMSLLPVIVWEDYHHTEKSSHCKSENGSYLLLLATVCFLIPLAIMVYCYTKVFLKVRRHRKLLNSWNRDNRSIKTEFRTTKIVFIVLATFIASWAPFVFLYVVSANTHESTIPPAVFKFCGFLSAAHSMCNPIIYFTMNRSFRRAAIGLIPFLRTIFPRIDLQDDRNRSATVSCDKRDTSLSRKTLSVDTLKRVPATELPMTAVN